MRSRTRTRYRSGSSRCYRQRTRSRNSRRESARAGAGLQRIVDEPLDAHLPGDEAGSQHEPVRVGRAHRFDDPVVAVIDAIDVGIGAAIAGQHVVARAADKDIVVEIAAQLIVEAAAFEAFDAGEDVAVGVRRHRPAAARVRAGRAGSQVDGDAAVRGKIAGDVGAVATVQGVGTGSTGQHIVAVAAEQVIVASRAEQPVIAGEAAQLVGGAVAAEHVGKRRAGQVSMLLKVSPEASPPVPVPLARSTATARVAPE